MQALLEPLLRAYTGAGSALAGPRLQVVLFHRVLAQQDPLFPREVDAAQFGRLMQAVQRVYDVLPFGEAAAALREGRLPPRALVVTFDDGYADNETQALPILRQLGLRGSFFISTGFLDGGRMWNDSIIEYLRRTTRTELELSGLGLGRLRCSSLDERRAAIVAIIAKIKYMDFARREEALDILGQACGRPALPTDLMMRSEQVVSLHRAGMEIGAHTVNHPILTEVSDEVARDEIVRGREALQQLTGSPVTTFAYPNGAPQRDYAARHVEMVRALGFSAACSTAAGVSRQGDDLFQLPRFTPWDRSVPRWLLRLGRVRHRVQFDRVAVAGPA